MTSEIRLIFWAFSDVIDLLLIGTCPVFSYSNTVQIRGLNLTGLMEQLYKWSIIIQYNIIWKSKSFYAFE